MKTPSITRRLVLALTAGAAILWLLGALFSTLAVRNELERTLDSGLRETAERLMPLAVDSLNDDHDGDRDRTPRTEPDRSEAEHSELVVYQVRDADGRVLLYSHDAPREGFDAPLSEGFATAGAWRIYTAHDDHSDLFIQVADSMAGRSAAVLNSVAALLLPLLLLVPLGAVGIHFAVKAGLSSLHRVGEEVARRNVGNLAPLGLSGVPAEVRPMTAAIDDLLQRLRAAFEAERALAANSAHELRTPIAGSLAQTQRLVDELEGHPAQTRALRVEETLQRLSSLAGKLLALSRAEAGTARTAAGIDLLPALKLVAADAVSQQGSPPVLRIADGATLNAPIDLDAFGIVMRNLIENARLHGRAGQPIDISVPRSNVIEVTNPGQVVAEDTLRQLTRRFARGETTAAGTGLGLTIVDAIMRQVGGRLELLSPGTGRNDGFTARLLF